LFSDGTQRSITMSAEARLKTESAEYQKLQVDLSKVVENTQQLNAQLAETQSVRDVFVTLKAENTVYKMIGPVLVEQDSAEAKANVNKRLEFIQTELKRAETQIKDLSEKIDKKKEVIVELQSSQQQTLQDKTAATVKAATAKA